MWPTSQLLICALGSSLAFTRSITGSGPYGTKLSAPISSKRLGVKARCISLCSPESKQIPSHQGQQQQQLDPET